MSPRTHKSKIVNESLHLSSFFQKCNMGGKLTGWGKLTSQFFPQGEKLTGQFFPRGKNWQAHSFPVGKTDPYTGYLGMGQMSATTNLSC